jgi:transposase InsO family protein
MSLHRSTYRYQRRRPEIDHRHERTVQLSEDYDYWGYRKIYNLLKGEQIQIGRERVRLIRRREGLQVPTKFRKRRVLGQSTRLVRQAEYPNHVWSYDFVHDQTLDGRRLKFLTVVDEFHRAGLAVACARSLMAIDVIRVLSRLIQRHGRPVCLRSDNGPEFIADSVKVWLNRNGIDTHYIEPGSPWQNAYNESFNSIFRTTCLNRWAFESVAEAKAVSGQWLEEYNTIRPHGSLAGRSPSQFIKDWEDARSTSTQRKRRSLT